VEILSQVDFPVEARGEWHHVSYREVLRDGGDYAIEELMPPALGGFGEWVTRRTSWPTVEGQAFACLRDWYAHIRQRERQRGEEDTALAAARDAMREACDEYARATRRHVARLRQFLLTVAP
jgi:hypothetical protein